MNPRFAGKVAIVTGGVHGIGRAVVDLLTSEGAIVVVSDLDPAGSELPAAFAAKKRTVAFVQGDMESEAFCKPLPDPIPLKIQFPIGRSGDWKAIKLDQSFDGTNDSRAWELYDLSRDPAELNDLATEFPDKVKELSAAFFAWQKQMPKPAPPPAATRTEAKQQ